MFVFVFKCIINSYFFRYTHKYKYICVRFLNSNILGLHARIQWLSNVSHHTYKKALGRLNWGAAKQKQNKIQRNMWNMLTTPAGHVTRIKRKVAKGWWYMYLFICTYRIIWLEKLSSIKEIITRVENERKL